MTQALLTAKPPTISTQHVVELGNVGMRFGNKKVLDNVSLVVDPGEHLVVIGQSGAGKTTVLRLILGILKPNESSVFFKQHEVSRMNDHELEQVRDADGDGISRFSAAEFAHCSGESCSALAGVDE
jgi:ABC-type transporter Mla maintaining outer membrane lipid asymmetry ATPase subunit MlaF